MKVISKRTAFLFSTIFFLTISFQEKENKIEQEILTKALTDIDYASLLTG
ncbi:hypothetical protein [Sinomicrobium weinanense]|uniref:Uncharacterized protein n=1 Tax=Sinomicrobium weinanense TaxID=2842200 RepID=A0A926JUW6_9FLAO|nr:hypothetical protein [Sinomicrobium weinanense]MBC9797806.1 hypothetical protein [Sinomicrobium weinanense]MBU3125955.1 hypothetical protein [Sinomicrobium weinanense]